MTSWTTARTEVIKASDIREGDRIVDPEGRGMLSVFHVEVINGQIWVDAIARRRVLRRFWPSWDIKRCIPS